jgi:hypothetical protein
LPKSAPRSVSNTLESSVRQAAEQVRVTAQLIQVADQTHLWAQTYEREYRDLFLLQSDIAAHVADSLELGVLPQAFAAAERNPQLSPETHAAYLRGRYFWARRSLLDPTNIRRAKDYFEGVVAAASQFAEGYTALGRLYHFQALYAAPGEKQALRQKAEATLPTALTLNPQLASAHAALASLRFQYDWDWEGGGRLLRYEPLKWGVMLK